MTLNQKLSLIKKLHKPYNREYSIPALAKRYNISKHTVRYHLDDSYRIRVLENMKKWQRDNKEYCSAYHQNYYQINK